MNTTREDLAQARERLQEFIRAAEFSGDGATMLPGRHEALGDLALLSTWALNAESDARLRDGLRPLEPYARAAEMRWMSMEDATIEIPARVVAEACRALLSASQDTKEPDHTEGGVGTEGWLTGVETHRSGEWMPRAVAPRRYDCGGDCTLKCEHESCERRPS